MSAHAKSKANFDELINKAADIFQGFSHPLRLSICLELANGKKSVSQLCAVLHQPQHSVSQHLALLRKQQMVESVKESRQVFYWVDDVHVLKVLGCVKSGIEEFSGSADAEESRQHGKSASDAGGFAKVFISNVKPWSNN